MSIFFGWYIVIASIILTGYHSSLFIYGLTAFLTPIASTTAWTYTQISLGSSLRGLEVGLLDPVAGIIIDRWPARRLMIIGTIVFVGGLICISQAPNLGIFYLGFLIVGLGSAFCHSMVPMTIIARWFRKNLGKASGLLFTGVAIGGLFVPLIVRAIDTWGWRDVMLFMGLGSLVLGIPLSFVFRSRPEDYGQFPDGKTALTEEAGESGKNDLTLKQAVRTRAFWLIGLVGTFQMVGIHAVTVHTIPHLESLGMDRSVAAVGVTIISLMGLGMRFLYGVLADIFGAKYMYILSNGITTVGLVLLGFLDGNSFAMLVLFGVVYGLGVSGAMPLRIPIIREYFGIRNYGSIFGMLSVFTVLGGITGAPLAGWVYDNSGLYFPIWFVFAGLTSLGTMLLLLLPRRSYLENNQE